MKKNIFLLLVLSVFLSGCTSMNSDFDCPRASPVLCKSLDEINEMVDYGELN